MSQLSQNWTLTAPELAFPAKFEEIVKKTEGLFEFYTVGGAVRNIVLGVTPKDIDLVVVANKDKFPSPEEAYLCLEQVLTENLRVYVRKPEWLFIKCNNSERVIDITVAYTKRDGKRELATLEENLLVRDFTMNALAVDRAGKLIYVVEGVDDIKNKIIRFVGCPETRVKEDPIRILRAIRFFVTLGFNYASGVADIVYSNQAAEYLKDEIVDRIYKELLRMFEFDTLSSMKEIYGLPVETKKVIFKNLYLIPTVKVKDYKVTNSI